MTMELEDIYENIENVDMKDTCAPHCQDEGKAQKQRGSRCLVLITMSLGLICVLLLVFIILLHITITAERDLIKFYKNTVEEFNQTINSLQDNYTDLTQQNLVLETKVKNLTAKNNQLERDFDSLNKKCTFSFFMSTEMSWFDSRQYCRDRGADLAIINTELKQRFISSLVKEIVWIGLSDRQQEGIMKWVDNSTLNQGFWESNEPNDADGNEDCIELNPSKSFPNNWNDVPCTNKRKWICENYCDRLSNLDVPQQTILHLKVIY
ncbi:CD209 antigen-like protein C isoform X1 [Carassius carassius]|uniref:CD209 antigen-like protein C isoform X1 n=2 Tax=Carassius carassius TaxID=217509 RepID=UPI002868AD18|nr:CD209 antigen-like protein C isoform X1 [Carassius carassius]